MLISARGTHKSQLQRDQESMEDTSVLSRCPLLRYPRPKPTGVMNLHVELPTVGSPFLGACNSRIPKATEEFDVHFIIRSLISRANSLRAMPRQLQKLPA